MPRTKKSALTTQDPGRGKEVARVTRQVSGRSINNLSIGDYLQPICQDILTKNAFCIRSSRVARLTTVQYACARHCVRRYRKIRQEYCNTAEKFAISWFLGRLPRPHRACCYLTSVTWYQPGQLS